MSLRRLLAFSAFLATLAAACKKDSTNPPVPTSVTLNTNTVSLTSLGQTQQLTASVLDQNGNAMTGQTVTWSSTNTGVATVNPATGLVTAVANGNAQVTATSGTLNSPAANVTVAQAAASLQKVSGDAQTDTAGQQLPTPLTAQVNDALGGPAAGITVNFVVAQGGGTLSAPSGVTAANGRASVSWTIGTAAGATQTVTVSAAGTSSVSFGATAVAGAPANVTVQAGDAQTSPSGLPVPVAPAVLVRDQFNNAVAGAAVAFAVGLGGGSLTGGSQTTNASGIATVGSWTLGAAGANSLIATVTGAGITGNPLTFTATATAAGAPASVIVSAGDAQTGLVGFALNVNPAVLVRDAATAPVSGVQVDFLVTGGGGSATGLSTTTNAQGIATVGSWTIGASAGANTMTATVTGGGITGNPVTFTATGQAAAYNIDIRYLTAVTPAQQVAFDSAKARWERVIYGDLPDINPLNRAAGPCAGGIPDLPAINENVDDIIIYARLDSIDGAFNVLGRAAPCNPVRSGSLLIIVGVMQFDTADVSRLLTQGQFDETVLHEMGHVLGLGTLWSAKALLVDPAGSGGTDPHFTGAQAVAAFDRSGGLNYSAGLKVPVENTGGPGTQDGHWRETVFDTELMTGFLDAAVPNPFSVITTASMQDLGYTVNYAASDSYVVANPLAFRAAGGREHLFGDVLRLPFLVTVDGAGRVTGVIHPR